ncbi:MAG: NADH-quinone oxidoreductase subunit A [Acidimicrobiales bacterium]
MAQYLPILALTVLAVLFAAGSFVASKLLAPRRPTVEKYAPYECGIVPGREPPQRFPVRFYLVAMLFIIFDIEIIFLYPWAMVHRELALPGLIAMIVFSLLVFESFVYLISKGALDWGPLQVNTRQHEMRSSARTTTTTIRRVGTDGRFDEVRVPDRRVAAVAREDVA